MNTFYNEISKNDFYREVVCLEMLSNDISKSYQYFLCLKCTYIGNKDEYEYTGFKILNKLSDSIENVHLESFTFYDEELFHQENNGVHELIFTVAK